MAISTQSVVPSRNQLIVSALCKRLNLESKNFQGDILQKDIKSLWASILTTLESNGENKEDFGKTFEQILIEKDTFEPPASKNAEKVETDSNAKKAVQDKKDANSVEKGSSSNKNANAIKGDGQVVIEKKKLPEKVADEKDKDISVSLLKIQVGLIRKAWKHPSADSLLVEEIDTGDAKLRQVVSGLAKYCSPDELTNRRVVLITNVKPGKLRDVMSEGLTRPDHSTSTSEDEARLRLRLKHRLGEKITHNSRLRVLCASSEDHSVVEPLIAPEGAKVGECISFSGHEGKPEDVLNPKKKQLEKITPHLFTDDKGVATFEGIPFMTSAGPCTSSIPKASIK
ncbi:hypothetical protein HYC85_006136 [Camellia sinensis]|uniref:tRNA-binding domain-containing protein n=1 Tax=Camellia sinensis TaxID=4442 RepID=A0A7J7I2X5_CAMSI|nr:hypothetical protein HYC85_006136 [Camellia sinensis]